ncbi:MAG: glycosyltransferase family 4 protein [Acidiferrobacterales bacterium]|nr:glycosyltransferase family 4 protein [Acidiferrobacterales bacterium]
MKEDTKRQLLVIGPVPPPLSGTSVSFQLFCDYVEANSDAVTLRILNSSPKKPSDRPLLDLGNFFTAKRVLWGCLKHVRASRKVILFGSNQFLLTLMPICFVISRIAGKKFYVRCFGGSLDSYYETLSPVMRRYFTHILTRIDGLIVQTSTLKNFFDRIDGVKVHQVPGYRNASVAGLEGRSVREHSAPMRLVYVGHVREEKGIFDLLESLRTINSRSNGAVECDLYGPIYDDVADRFNQEISQTDGANYKGILDSDKVIPTLNTYDVFVFPTYYQGEGHPGAVIEALIAGLPVITTHFKSIPDLIEDKTNGLLVTPQKTDELIAAIEMLFGDSVLLETLSKKAAESGKTHHLSKVIPRLLHAVDE